MKKPTFRASNTPLGLTENMQILTGQKGDRLDKALTLRDAAAFGILNLRRSSSGVIEPELPTVPPTDPEWSGVQPPVSPTNVTATGAFHTVTLTWDIPAYRGHAYAEILRAEVDNPANSIAVGTTLTNVYADTVGKGFEAFYWVRFINKNGLAGPLSSTAGLKTSTSPDVDEIIASASRFAIYNPAKPAEKEIIFGVTDEGKVAIREAVIKAATIQIIHSEKITADYIKAGVSISAPLITGGQFDMGNAFMAGGSAGFGKGGPYSGWGAGWNTIIYADGNIYSNRLQAEGGYLKNMTVGNCTVEEDCVVKGVTYADKIIGGIAQAVTKPCNQYRFDSPINEQTVTLATFNISEPSIRPADILFIDGVVPVFVQEGLPIHPNQPSGSYARFGYRLNNGDISYFEFGVRNFSVTLPANFTGSIELILTFFLANSGAFSTVVIPGFNKVPNPVNWPIIALIMYRIGNLT